MDLTPMTVKIEYGVSRPRRLGNVIERHIIDCESKEAAEAHQGEHGGVVVCRTITTTAWTLAEVEEGETW